MLEFIDLIADFFNDVCVKIDSVPVLQVDSIVIVSLFDLFIGGLIISAVIAVFWKGARG